MERMWRHLGRLQSGTQRQAQYGPQGNRYGPTGALLNIWAAWGLWEGALPQHFHGDKRAGGWAWDYASAKSVRINAKIDGTGGLSVEAGPSAGTVHASRFTPS
jgi:hypothetical protein